MNSLYLYIESNGLFILLLLVLLMNLGHSSAKIMDEKLFQLSVILNILVLVADTGCWICDGRVFMGEVLVNKLVYCAYYITTAMFVFVWGLYATYKLQKSWGIVKSNIFLLIIPLLVAIFLSIQSFWNECLYSFDINGVYHRGELFAVHTTILWFYLMISLVSVIMVLFSDKRDELMRECVAIIISVVIPVIGGIFQTAYYGFNMAWTGSSISLVIMFIGIQGRQISIDALTGVHNRGSFEKYLRENVEKQVKDNKLYLIMIDIDKFKQINDKYGHVAGDRALVETAKALLGVSQITKKDFIARYGGDEFAIVCYRKSEKQLDKLIYAMEEECARTLTKEKLGFDMTFSVGYAEYSKETYVTVEKFIDAADVKMYENKIDNKCN